MRRYTHTPAHPDIVAGLKDANRLRGLAFALEQNLDELSAQGARSGVMHAITILNGAARQLTP